jgi:hypothetical protein
MGSHDFSTDFRRRVIETALEEGTPEEKARR